MAQGAEEEGEEAAASLRAAQRLGGEAHQLVLVQQVHDRQQAHRRVGQLGAVAVGRRGGHQGYAKQVARRGQVGHRRLLRHVCGRLREGGDAGPVALQVAHCEQDVREELRQAPHALRLRRGDRR